MLPELLKEIIEYKKELENLYQIFFLILVSYLQKYKIQKSF